MSEPLLAGRRPRPRTTRSVAAAGCSAIPRPCAPSTACPSTLQPGRTLGLVGESGCGKTTTARLVLGLVPVTAGEIRLARRDLPPAGSVRWRELRRRMQMVYQDPLGALDRRIAVGKQVMEPLVIHGHRRAGRAARAARWRCCERSACRRTTSTAIRTSSRAASASASCSPAR